MEDGFCMWPYCSCVYSLSMSMTIANFTSNKQILYKFVSLIKSGHQIVIFTVDVELFLTPECRFWSCRSKNAPLSDNLLVGPTL